MTIETAPSRNVFINDAEDRRLAGELFDALRAASFDGVGITRESYSGRESAALDIVEAKARELGLEWGKGRGIARQFEREGLVVGERGGNQLGHADSVQ